MGIHLELEEYCQDGSCGIFDPEVDTNCLRVNNKAVYDTRIRCSHRAICQHVCDFFEKRGRELGYIQDKPTLYDDPSIPNYR